MGIRRCFITTAKPPVWQNSNIKMKTPKWAENFVQDALVFLEEQAFEDRRLMSTLDGYPYQIVATSRREYE